MRRMEISEKSINEKLKDRENRIDFLLKEQNDDFKDILGDQEGKNDQIMAEIKTVEG